MERSKNRGNEMTQKNIFISLLLLTYTYGEELMVVNKSSMIHIEKGSYIMGSHYGDKDEKPTHKVTFDYDFEIAKYEVSIEEFKAFIDDTGYKTDAENNNSCNVYVNDAWIPKKDVTWKNPDYPQEANHPVVCVSWEDSKQYLKWLNKQTGKSYRLLSEAEWEYVAKAGTYSKWSFGNNKKDLKFYANIADKLTDYPWKEKWNDGHKYTAAVGSYKANQFGVYDMYGNVWEWCEDSYSKNYENTPRDGRANNMKHSKKVFRGASWINFPTSTRSANRFFDISTSRYNVIGFRIARTLKKK